MKYIYWGGKAIGEYVLQGLIKHNEVPDGIVLYKDIIDGAIIKKAESLGTKIIQIHNFKKQQKELIKLIKELNITCYISVAFPFILPEELIKIVQYPINIHTSALPKYRGHHPLSAALLNDDPYQATTVHLMDKEVDAGKILLQDFIKITNEDTIITIRMKLMELSLELILLTIAQLRQGLIYPRKQVGEATWAPKRTPEDSKIKFSQTSRHLHNFIRALVNPYPNAFAYRENGDVVRIGKSIASNTPGVVLVDLGNRQYVVSSGDGVILIETDCDLEVNEILK